MTSNKDFDGDLVYTWVAQKSEISQEDEEFIERYAIVSNPEADSGIIIYGYSKGKWEANPPNLKPLIKNLYTKLNRIELRNLNRE